MITVETRTKVLEILDKLCLLHTELLTIRDNARTSNDVTLAEETIEAMHKVSDAFGLLIDVDDYIMSQRRDRSNKQMVI